MKIGQQVCNLEQAKRLQNLGILQNSTWYFLYYSNGDKFYINLKKTADNLYGHCLKKYGDQCVLELCAAFTVSELAWLLQIETGALDPVILANQLIEEIESGRQNVEIINLRFFSDDDMLECAPEVFPIRRAS